MLSAVLRKKLRLTEDCATAAFFDAIRVHDQHALLRDIAKACRTIEGRCLTLPEFDALDVELWPDYGTFGEPDARLVFTTANRAQAVLLVEAKLGAPKSGEDDASSDLPDRGPRDQLARYLIGESRRTQDTPCLGILYLTHHPSAPSDDIVASLRALERWGRSDLARIYWLSWRDIQRLLHAHSSSHTPWGRACVDLADTLELAGQFRFGSGWPAPPDVTPSSWYSGRSSRGFNSFGAFVAAGVPSIPTASWQYPAGVHQERQGPGLEGGHQ